MNPLVRTELLKQRTLRIFYLGVLSAPLVAGLVAVAVLGGAGRDGNDPLGPDSLAQTIGAPASVITIVALLLGILGTAGEYRHETITTTFLSTPRRRNVVLAKLVAHSLIGALIGVLSLTVTIAIGVPWLQAEHIDTHVDGDLLRVMVGVLVSTALHGALGVSVGALIRNQTAACTIVLVWLLAVEGVIGTLLHGGAMLHWLPVATAHAMVRSGSPGAGLSAPVAAGVFTIYLVTLAVAAVRLTIRRDIT